MSTTQIDEILTFLEDWPTDDNLSSPFINNIMHKQYIDGNLNYLPYEDDIVSSFWFEHITFCSHFYVYAILNKWLVESSSNLVAQRKDAYSDKFTKEIVKEMEYLLRFLENSLIQNVNKEYIEESVNSFLNDYVSSVSLMSIFCEGLDFKYISQKYAVSLIENTKIADSKSTLTFLLNFLSSYQPDTFNTVAGKYYISTIVQILSERFDFDQFHDYSIKIKSNYNLVEWQQLMSQLKTTISNCLLYCVDNNISIDGIVLGLTNYEEADKTKRKNQIDGESYPGSSWKYGKIEYNGFDISFKPENDGVCCGFHLYNGWGFKDCKEPLNHFLSQIFHKPNTISANLSYNDFLILLKNNDFFELQEFHPTSKYRSDYSVKWRKVTSAHICDFIFSIEGEKGMGAEDVKKIKDVTIQLDIYINDNRNQEELYKKEPIPSLDSDDYDSSSSTSDYEYDMGFMGLVGG